MSNENFYLTFFEVWVLKKNGFNANFSIIINGTLHEYFKASNRIRQGYPLSLLLFIVVTNILNRMLARGKTNNLFNGIQIPNRGSNVMNIQFTEPSQINVENLLRTLSYFQLAFGLKMNFYKSSITDIGICSTELECYMNILGCAIENFPLSYLGLPLPTLRIGPLLSINWSNALFGAQKSRYLSIGRKFTFYNSILSILHFLVCTFLKRPKRESNQFKNRKVVNPILMHQENIYRSK